MPVNSHCAQRLYQPLQAAVDRQEDQSIKLQDDCPLFIVLQHYDQTIQTHHQASSKQLIAAHFQAIEANPGHVTYRRTSRISCVRQIKRTKLLVLCREAKRRSITAT